MPRGDATHRSATCGALCPRLSCRLLRHASRLAPSRQARLLEHLPCDVRDAERRVVAAVGSVLNGAEYGVDVASAHGIGLATRVAREGARRARALVETGPGGEVRLSAGKG